VRSASRYTQSPNGSVERLICGGLVANIIWFVFAGWWLAIAHVLLAVALATIGLPFAWAHIKLADASLPPLGKMIVPIA
jgi:uncharacterized membrane protein YccF (DUF307 family)